MGYNLTKGSQILAGRLMPALPPPVPHLEVLMAAGYTQAEVERLMAAVDKAEPPSFF